MFDDVWEVPNPACIGTDSACHLVHQLNANVGDDGGLYECIDLDSHHPAAPGALWWGRLCVSPGWLAGLPLWAWAHHDYCRGRAADSPPPRNPVVFGK